MFGTNVKMDVYIDRSVPSGHVRNVRYVCNNEVIQLAGNGNITKENRDGSKVEFIEDYCIDRDNPDILSLKNFVNKINGKGGIDTVRNAMLTADVIKKLQGW